MEKSATFKRQCVIQIRGLLVDEAEVQTVKCETTGLNPGGQKLGDAVENNEVSILLWNNDKFRF